MISRLLAFLALTLVPAAATAEGCKAIRFAPGSTSGAIEGVAPPEDVLCYRIEVGDGQAARVQVKGTNMMFTIPDLADGRDDFTWTTSAGSYEIRVMQLSRSATDQPFTLLLSISGG